MEKKSLPLYKIEDVGNFIYLLKSSPDIEESCLINKDKIVKIDFYNVEDLFGDGVNYYFIKIRTICNEHDFSMFFDNEDKRERHKKIILDILSK